MPGAVAESVDEVAEAQSQAGVVMGRVVDTSGQGVPMANVQVRGLPIGAATNTDGEFLLARLPAGAYVVLASEREMGRDSVSVNVAPNDTSRIEIVLD